MTAADLLLGAQIWRTAAPVSRVADNDTAFQAITESLHSGLGLGAMEGNELVGFLIVPLPSGPGPARITILDTQHGASQPYVRDAYRALYEAAAAELVNLGCFWHKIRVLTEPPESVDSFVEMGFGIDQIKGSRPISPTLSSGQIRSIEEAVRDDVNDLARLWVELATYHARSPILNPALVDLPAIRNDLVATIEDEGRKIFVARQNGNAVGMIEAHPDAHYQDTVTIGLNIVTGAVRSQGIGTTLLEAVMRWSGSAGYQHCAVSWASPNLVSDAFYRAHGFVPIRYELARQIDPRVSWANESLNFSLLDGAWRSAESGNE